MINVRTEGFWLGSRNGGTCSICGKGDTDPESGRKTPVLSLGVQIEFEGNFDICFGCAHEIGLFAGMIDGASYDLLLEDYNRVCSALEDQNAAILNKENAVALLSGELAGAAKRGVYGK